MACRPSALRLKGRGGQTPSGWWGFQSLCVPVSERVGLPLPPCGGGFPLPPSWICCCLRLCATRLWRLRSGGQRLFFAARFPHRPAGGIPARCYTALSMLPPLLRGVCALLLPSAPSGGSYCRTAGWQKPLGGRLRFGSTSPVRRHIAGKGCQPSLRPPSFSSACFSSGFEQCCAMHRKTGRGCRFRLSLLLQ